MKNYRKHIDDFFREKLGWYSETPPPDVWDDLDGRLDTLKPIVRHFPYRVLWHFAIVSGILVLGVSMASKIYHNQSNSSNSQIAANISNVPQTTSGGNITTKENNGVIDASATNEAPTEATKLDASVNKNGNTVATTTPLPTKTLSDIALPTGNDRQANKSNKTTNTITTKDKNVTAKNIKGEAAMKKDAAVNQSTIAGIERTTPQNPEHNNYNSSLSNKGEAKESLNKLQGGNTEHNDEPAAGNKTQPVQNAMKKDSTTAKKTIAEEKKNTHTHPLWLKRFEAGVKMGYERGMDNQAATKYIVSPYLQYNLSKKLSVMTQPAAKYATLAGKKVGTDNSYTQMNADGKVVQDGPSVITTVVDGGNVDTFYKTKYTYSQSHDSIVKSYRRGGSYTEFEIPLLLKYSLTPKLAVYGGVNIIFSKVTAITEHTFAKKGIVKSFDTTITTQGSVGTPPSVSSMAPYISTPFFDDGNSLGYSRPQESKITVGYMLGFSYKFSHRWLFDALMTQSPYKPYIVGGYNANAPISLPYFRLTAGYRIIK